VSLRRSTFALALCLCCCGGDDVRLPVTSSDVSNAQAGGAQDGAVAASTGYQAAAPATDALDAGTCSAPSFVLPALDAGAGLRLSQLGLYQDVASKQVACDLIPYQPRAALWSDGAEKQRWLRLPAGARIDNSDPDALHFPVGTVLFKEFRLAGKRLETRVLARLDSDPSATFFGAFAWLDDESDALLVSDALADVRGTPHDIPAREDCQTCHRGEHDHVLGFSTVQQPDVSPSLFASPYLPLELAGDTNTVSALGYLHANCGHCHNPHGMAFSKTSLVLRLAADQTDPLQTTIYRETVGKLLDRAPIAASISLRVSPGQPDASALIARMQTRGSNDAMPPIATELPDPQGIAVVRAWIAALPAN
jgi:hypothetical protein